MIFDYLGDYRWVGVYDVGLEASKDGSVVVTIDVESKHTNAFSQREQDVLEEFAQAVLPLWVTG